MSADTASNARVLLIRSSFGSDAFTASNAVTHGTMDRYSLPTETRSYSKLADPLHCGATAIIARHAARRRDVLYVGRATGAPVVGITVGQYVGSEQQKR